MVGEKLGAPLYPDYSKSKGKVYLVGAGPGAPGLITVRGVDVLRQAEVVVYDYLASPKLLKYAPPDAELIYVGKKSGRHTMKQQDITKLLAGKAEEGKRVVRLKGGDPFIFGRGGEEAEVLNRAGISFEIIPGVSSAVAAPAYAGIPLTHRDYTSSVAFFTGHEKEDKGNSAIDWEKISTGIGTLVFLMGVANLEHISSQLIKHGRSPGTPAALVRWGTTGSQRTLVSPLAEITSQAKAQGFRPPSVLVVGEVVQLREKLNWFERQPLFGKGIVVTRAREQASRLSEALVGLGAEVAEFPTIQIVPPASYAELDKALAHLSAYDWLIFTSVNGVAHFLGRLKANGLDIRELRGCKLCAIGPATAGALEDLWLRVDVVPDEYRAEAIILALGEDEIKGRRFLLPRAEAAREVLPNELRRLGAVLDEVTAYRTVKTSENTQALEQKIADGQIHLITFTSSSTVTNFVELFGQEKTLKLLSDVTVASIGPITAHTARKFGINSHIIPKEYTIPALVEAIVEHFAAAPPVAAPQQ